MLLLIRCVHLQGRMVLLAEDNLINQRVAKMMLSSLGMTVEVVSNGQEAVDAVKRRVGQDGVRQFDVLLMDMAMPVMGGVDATKVCCHSFLLCLLALLSCASCLFILCDWIFCCLSCVRGCSAVRIEHVGVMSQASLLSAASVPRLHICCVPCHLAACHQYSVSLLPCAYAEPWLLHHLLQRPCLVLLYLSMAMQDPVPILCGCCPFCCLLKGSALHKCLAFALHRMTCDLHQICCAY